MLSNNNNSNTTTTTTTTTTQTMTLVQNCSENGKRYLHLVLREKPFAEKIVEELKAEIEKRLEIYLNTHIFPQLEKIDVSEFNNPEQSMKVIIISSIQEVLKEMMKENLLMLCPEDFALVEQIINSEEKEINKPTQQNIENKDDKPKNENENKDDNSSGFKNIINKIFG